MKKLNLFKNTQTLCYALLLSTSLCHAGKGPYTLLQDDAADNTQKPIIWEAPDRDAVNPLYDTIAELRTFQNTAQALYAAASFEDLNAKIATIATYLLDNIDNSTFYASNLRPYLELLDEYAGAVDVTPLFPLWTRIAQDSANPNAFKAAENLFIFAGGTERAIGRDALRTIAQTPGHKDAYASAEALYFHGNGADRIIGRAVICRIAQDPTDDAFLGAVGHVLRAHHPDEDRSATLAILRNLPHTYFEEKPNAAQFLFDYGNDADREKVRPFLYQAAHNPKLAEAFSIAQILSYGRHNNDEDKKAGRTALEHLVLYPHDINLDGDYPIDPEFKKIIRPLLHKIAQDPTHKNVYSAAQRLISSIFGSLTIDGQAQEESPEDNEDKEIALASLRKTAQTPHHPNAYAATEDLSCNGSDDDMALTRAIITRIAKCPTHYYAFDASWDLLRKEDAEGLEGLRRIARIPDHHHANGAAELLYGHGNEGDKALARPIMYKLMVENPILSPYEHPTHRDAYAAADLLFRSSNVEDKTAAHACLREIVQNTNDIHSFDAASLLFASSSVEDKGAARACLKRIVQSTNNIRSFDAAKLLLSRHDEPDKAWIIEHIKQVFDKNEASADVLNRLLSLLRECDDYGHGAEFLKTLRMIASTPHHPLTYEAALQLLDNNDTDSKLLGISALRSIVATPDHKMAPWAAALLFECDNVEDKALARPILQAFMTSDIAEPEGENTPMFTFKGEKRYQDQAAKILFKFGNDADREAARPLLRAMVKKTPLPPYHVSYSNHMSMWGNGHQLPPGLGNYPRHATGLLFKFGNDLDKSWVLDHMNIYLKDYQGPEGIWAYFLYKLHEDTDLESPIILKFMQDIAQDTTHPNAYDATKWLWERGTNRAWVRNHIQQVFDNNKGSEDLRGNYIRMLRESDIVEDRTLGLALQQKYGPDPVNP